MGLPGGLHSDVSRHVSEAYLRPVEWMLVSSAMEGGEMSVLSDSELKDIQKHAAAHGYMELFNFTLDAGAPSHEESLLAAAEHNQLEMVLLDNVWGIYTKCPNPALSCAAAQGGSVELLKRLHDRGVLSFDRVSSVEPRTFERLHRDARNSASAAGNVEALQWMLEIQAGFSMSTWTRAITYERIKVLRWAHQMRLIYCYKILLGHAIRCGSLPCLTWLIDEVGDCDLRFFCEIASYGPDRVDVIAWGRARNYPWGKFMQGAVECKNTNLLRWGLANGAPLYPAVYRTIIKANWLEMLFYVIKETNGLGWDPVRGLAWAIEFEKPDMERAILNIKENGL